MGPGAPTEIIPTQFVALRHGKESWKCGHLPWRTHDRNFDCPLASQSHLPRIEIIDQ